MTDATTIDIDYVVSYCEDAAGRHREQAAAAVASPHVQNKPLRDQHLASAQMAEAIADHFRSQATTLVLNNPEVEALAREIDPNTYSSYDAMIQRLVGNGYAHDAALQLAEDAFNSPLSEARSKASESIETEAANPDVSDRVAGIEDAISWHELQAAEAERLEQREAVPAKKIKYKKRAERHRLYARHMRADLIEKREREAAERERELVAERADRVDRMPASDDIPLEVQRAFLKKTEVMDDEGW